MEEKKNFFHCRCCFAWKLSKYMCKCTEGHQVCRSCIKRSIHTKMSEGNPSAKCIALCKECCNADYPPEVIKQCVGKETFTEMIKQDTINAMYQSNIRDIFVCAHCGYQFSLINKRQYRVKCCPICNRGTCVLCGLKEHPGKTCKVALSDEQNLQKGISICPKCRCEFVKDKGCNMLKCPKCATNFCFVCGKIIPSKIGYNHFSSAKVVPKNKCPLRSKPKMHKEIEHKMEIILQDFMEEDRQFIEDDLPLSENET